VVFETKYGNPYKKDPRLVLVIIYGLKGDYQAALGIIKHKREDPDL
jgi:hypothetical protein